MNYAHFMSDGGWGVMGAVMGIVWIGFWIVVIVLVVSLLRGRARTTSTSSGALRVLEERYARGEIDRDEFMERRRVLLESRP
jgi:putative membrane protein